MQALFAYGSALMQKESSDTNSPLANFEQAIRVFKAIGQSYPQTEQAALALGEIGDCYLQLTNYDAATNAYAQVINSPVANISTRSQAQIGFGIALEKQAALATDGDQTNLLKAARDAYLDVFYGVNRHGDEQYQDAFWTKKAGLQALPLVEALGVDDPDEFIKGMEREFPESKDSLEKKRAALPPKKN